MIADNKLTENAEWDERLLAEQLKLKMLAEAEIDFDLEITGFEIGEIDCLLEGITPCNGHQDLHDVIPETELLSRWLICRNDLEIRSSSSQWM
jgi:hypothetical protein